MNILKYIIPFAAILFGSLLVINPLLQERSSFWLQISGAFILASLAVFPFMNKKTSELTEQAEVDALSNLYRRETFTDLLKAEIARAQRHEHTFSLIVFDIDHFKQINDVYGHAEGDKVITFFGEALHKLKREEDVAGRLGGEEFGLFLPETDAHGALTLAKRLQGYIRYKPTPKVKELTVSAGVAEYPAHARNEADLLDRADKALYRAKEKRDEAVIYRERSS